LGAQRIGGTGILIYTGKTKYPLPDNSVVPDYGAKNLKEVLQIISKY
jgi:FMN phosphatase YigB (HAD superfamily)